MQYSKTNSIYRESQQLIWVIYGETDKSAEAAKMPQKLNFAFFFRATVRILPKGFTLIRVWADVKLSFSEVVKGTGTIF